MFISRERIRFRGASVSFAVCLVLGCEVMTDGQRKCPADSSPDEELPVALDEPITDVKAHEYEVIYFRVGEEGVDALSTSREAEKLCIAFKGGELAVMRWGAKLREAKMFGPYGGVQQALTFSKNGNCLLAAVNGLLPPTLVEIDLRTGNERFSKHSTRGVILWARYIGDSKSAVCVCDPGEVVFWHLDEDRILGRLRLSGVFATRVDISADDRYIAIITVEDKGQGRAGAAYMSFIDCSNMELYTYPLDVPGIVINVSALAFIGPRELLLCLYNGEVRKWTLELKTGRWVQSPVGLRLPQRRLYTSLFWPERGELWLAGRSHVSKLTLDSLRHEVVFGPSELEADVTSLALAPNGRSILIGLSDCRIIVCSPSQSPISTEACGGDRQFQQR